MPASGAVQGLLRRRPPLRIWIEPEDGTRRFEACDHDHGCHRIRPEMTPQYPGPACASGLGDQDAFAQKHQEKVVRSVEIAAHEAGERADQPA